MALDRPIITIASLRLQNQKLNVEHKALTTEFVHLKTAYAQWVKKLSPALFAEHEALHNRYRTYQTRSDACHSMIQAYKNNIAVWRSRNHFFDEKRQEQKHELHSPQPPKYPCVLPKICGGENVLARLHILQANDAKESARIKQLKNNFMVSPRQSARLPPLKPLDRAPSFFGGNGPTMQSSRSEAKLKGPPACASQASLPSARTGR